MNEDTGSPADLKITQEDGFVWFSFTDQSLCEDGFSLHRTQRDQKTVLAPSYQYFASNECGDIIKPGKDFADDLSRSNLIVGEIFAYCVSAVAPNYMAQPSTIENLHPPFKKQSDSTCESHTIQWVRIDRSCHFDNSCLNFYICSIYLGSISKSNSEAQI